MSLRAVVLGLIVVSGGTIASVVGLAETCTTQSQMSAGERNDLASAAQEIAAKVQANDAAGLRAETIAEFTNNFGGLQNLIAETAPRLKGGAITVDQIYLLDASQSKAAQSIDAQFFCTLNRSASEAEFLITGLIPGVYGFAVVRVSASPVEWVVPMLLRREQGRWLLGGIYPRATQAAGHDGLWYWREARRLSADKQRWNAWIYYGQAEALLKPANFVQSSHLEKLRDEQRSAAPPALSGGLGPDVPLVVKGPDGKEYQFTGVSTDDTLGKDKVDVSAHLRVDQIGDAMAARKRNEDAMHALLAAYPELRSSFHGIWIVAEPPGSSGQSAFATEQAMADLH